MCNDEWEKEDLIRLFETLLKISGLEEKTDEDNSNETDSEDGYSFLFASLLMNGTMSRNEILNSSLPYLNEIFKNVYEIRIKTSGFGGFGGITSQQSDVKKETCSTPQDFYS